MVNLTITGAIDTNSLVSYLFDGGTDGSTNGIVLSQRQKLEKLSGYTERIIHFIVHNRHTNYLEYHRWSLLDGSGGATRLFHIDANDIYRDAFWLDNSDKEYDPIKIYKAYIVGISRLFSVPTTNEATTTIS